MSMLRTDGKWSKPPPLAMERALELGLVTPGCGADEYVFPLASLLSHLEPEALSVAADVLMEFHDAAERQGASDLPLSYYVSKRLESCDERTQRVLWARSGLGPEGRMTLEQVGNELGLTRERVRQIQAHARDRLLVQEPVLRSLLRGFISHAMLRPSLTVTDEPPYIRCAAKWLGIPCAGVNLNVPGLCILGARKPKISQLVTKLRRGDCSAASASVAAHFAETTGLALPAADARLLHEKLCRRHLTKALKVCLALRSLGRPAHYSEVADAYARMYPDDDPTEHNVHAALGREEHGVVWIGLRGTFALKEWGYERPSKGLFETVAEIVEEVHARTGRPVPFTTITAEMGKYRKLVRPASLTIAAQCNARLRPVAGDAFLPVEAAEPAAEAEPIRADELDRILRGFNPT